MRALVMCLAVPTENPRPNRIIRLLEKSGFSVDTLSYPYEGNLPVKQAFFIIPPSSKLIAKLYRFSIALLSSITSRFPDNYDGLTSWLNNIRYHLNKIGVDLLGKNYDLIVVEDLQMLPYAFQIKGRANVLFDAREFYPKENEESLRFRLFEYPIRFWLCSKYLHRCDHVITVSPGLAQAYKTDFDIDMTVIRSVPFYHDFSLVCTKENEVRMVHHGLANKDRSLGKMIEIMKHLDQRYTLDFYLVGKEKNIRELKNIADGCSRIRFLNPVEFDEILPMLNQYDIGFYYLEPRGFNVTYNLPNKFFEFIQARLAIAIGPSPDMAELVNEYHCGFVAQAFTVDAMVQALQSLTPAQIDRAKRQSELAAKDLCYEKESEKLLEVIQKMFPGVLV
jgi:hypothetical protein